VALVIARAPDRVIRWFATLALLIVGGISAAGSFTHIRDMAASHGQDGWVSWAIAVSMELVVGMAALEILRDSRAGRHAGMPWLILLSGAALVLATNLATAERSPWGWILAGWPAVASMSATKLFVRRLRHAAEAIEQPRAAVLPQHATAAAPPRASRPLRCGRSRSSCLARSIGGRPAPMTAHGMTLPVPRRHDELDRHPARRGTAPHATARHQQARNGTLAAARRARLGLPSFAIVDGVSTPSP